MVGKTGRETGETMDGRQQAGPDALGDHLMFLALVAMGMAVFALCVVLPPVEQRARLERDAAALAETVELLEAELQRGRYVIDQLETNPIHMERLAVTEGYRDGNGRRVVIIPDTVEPVAADRFVADTGVGDESRPRWWTTLGRYRHAFLDREKRSAMLVLAAGLIVTAFALYRRHVPPPMPVRAEAAPVIEIDD